MKTKKDLTSAKLPKWPQMLVTGTTLPVEQALEIAGQISFFADAPETTAISSTTWANGLL